ncbi:MAG: primosomal protein N', partial [Candidatus Competibacteraceae bacterium]|nr:primosomal protein N' [Candidatus Competibacteraceae bacterium]
HDSSFKQQDGFRYHARDLAVVRGRQLGVPVVLGSATPALESCHNAQRRRYHLLPLPERVGGGAEPPIYILDVRQQPMREGLSQPLLERIRVHLDRDEQVLLFLNRRGFAPILLCHECGWSSQCRHCDARMTLHLRRQRLICHHCGDQRPVDAACPQCGSVDLRGFGQGTERLETALRQEFPETGIARMDRDSTRRRGSLEALLTEIQAGGRRLLIGTQMLAKGHHFPDVTLVGIIDADQGLYGIDFRASERMAQLILQVAGRAGRAEKPGVVIIQTHHPDHPLLRTLVSRGYAAFATEALTERQEALLPPFAHQALLRAEAVDPERATGFLQRALALAEPLADELELMGPAPAPMERRAGRYRAHLLIQAVQRQALHRFLGRWTPLLWAERTDRQVRWSLDIDPMELY